MGPQHTRCGKPGYAAASPSRPTAHFNGAATYSLRKAGGAQYGGRRRIYFNGAATYSLRKAVQAARAAARRKTSMGPQHTRCGKCTADCTPARRGRHFNGAATYSLRKVQGGGGPAGRGLHFNGAATYSLRKAASSNRTSLSNCLLQWGRNILVAESLFVLQKVHRKSKTSMGPQHTRCGK